MTCQRCNGLMVREQYDNLEFDSAGYEISGWRCLNCGAIVDPVISTHRQTTHKTEPDHEVRSGTVEGPYPNGDRFVLHFKYDVTPKHTGKRMTLDEAGLYTVQNGKIVKEEFFYSM